MMGFYHLGMLAFLGVISLITVQGQRILFLGSDVVRPGTEYGATVSNLGFQAASITVAIENNVTKIRIVAAINTISSGNQEAFYLPIPGDLDETGKYVVRVIDGVGYDNSTEVRVEKKSRSIFIVTDKSIYKPGANVFFRAFAVNSTLRPRDEPLSVEIFDPKGNKLKQWLNQAGENGVVSGEHQLSKVTSLGDWKIKATSGGEDQTLTFKVDEYVLPKFEVEVSLNPSFIVSSDNSMMSMTARVAAKYTIGTPVDGDLTLTVRPERTWYNIKSVIVNRKMFGVQNVDISFPAGTFGTCGICSMIVEASVVDSLSGENRTATTKFQTWRNAVKLSFLDGPKFIKPGLTSKFVLKITQQDGTPVADTGRQITMKVTQGSDTSKSVIEDYSYPFPPNGLLEIGYDVLPQTTTLRLVAEYNGASISTYLSQVFKTFSNQSIEVDRDMTNTSPNLFKFNVRSTEDINYIYYQVLSKKAVITAGRQNLQPPGKSVQIIVGTSPAIAPSATILVYYINSGNEVVATSQRFDVPLTFNNQMSMTWDQDRRKVNEDARLTVVAEPGSYISVSAVDQSVLLLGESNDITADRVTEELESYDLGTDQPCCGPVFFAGRPGRPRNKRSIWFPFFSASDTAKVIESAGLVYMTDAFIYRTPQINDKWLERGGVVDEEMLFDVAAPAVPDNGGDAEATEVYIRNFFPESWIWEMGTAGPDGKAVFSVKVPDTLTKWVATSFALHPNSGLGIPPQRANLTAFIPFFMRVAKPYSVIREEIITLKVLVFNYLGSTKDVTVTLQSSLEFEVLESPNSVIGESKTESRSVQVLDQKGATVSFTIRPLKIGLISLSLKANTAGAQDVLEDTLLVEPEGRLVETNLPIFVSLKGGQPFSASKTISFPQDVVEGSRMIKIKAIGDLLGTSLDGLSNLVRMPYGCGEQNMINFAPNIFVRKYMVRTDTLTSKVRADTTRNMEAGYERELTYQRNDGSFSAFGQSDKTGSTWLTSFVIDSFKQAQPYIFVDDDVLIKSLTWLIQNAYSTRDGTFREVGKVFHEEMQGGSLNTMTAYVLIALEKCRSLNQSVPGLLEAINGARVNLENSVATTSELYNLAIMGYALQLTGSPSATNILQKLEDQAQGVGSGVTYWKVTSEVETASCRSCNRPNNQVELASFVLLTYVRRKDLPKALPVARFLMSQKNPQGGFYSTQDTVWGLNALAEFSAASHEKGQQYTVSVSAGPSLTKEFAITDSNSQVLQIYEILDEQIIGNTIQVNVDVSGSGSGLVEVSSRYYTTQAEDSPKLKLEVGAESMNDNVRKVTSCVSVLDRELNDMIVVEINDPSGFPIDKNSIQPDDNNNIKLVEKDGKKTSIYYGDIPAGTKHCFSAMAYKQDDVENVKAPMARAFAYYSGDETSIVYMQSQPRRTETSTVVLSTEPTGDSSRLQACVLTSVLSAFLALLSV